MEQEAAWITRAQAGDRRAFERLLSAYYDRIYRMAYHFSGNRTDAADITQEVCLRLATRLEGFRGDSSFASWLYRITLNCYRDYCKKSSTQRNLDNAYMEYDALDKAGQADSNRQVAQLYRMLAGLGDELRETALLVVAQQLSHADAGAVLGVAESTISWRMHEVRKQLKQQMEARDA